MSGRAPGFSTGANGTLRRAGLTAMTIRVGLEDDRLVLTGAAGERVEISGAEITRLRCAEFPASATTQGFCETAIDRPGGCILLTANRNDEAYGRTIRAFAGAVPAEALRRGPGLGSALVMMALVIGSLTFLLAFLAMLAAWRGGWWWVPVLILAPLYLLAWRAQLRRQWPRRVRDPAELDMVLPPFTGARS